MADTTLIDQPLRQRDWPAFFRDKVAANVQFWLDQVPHWDSPFEALYTERHNVIKALERALQNTHDAHLTTRLLVTFHAVAERYGMWAEWEPFLQDGILLCQQQGAALQQAILLDRLGEVRRHQGDWDGAMVYHQSASQLSSQIGNQTILARASANLAQIYFQQGQLDQARQILERALACYQACQDREGQAFVHNTLGRVLGEQQQWDAALSHHHQALELWSEAGIPIGIAEAEQNMGNIYFFQGHLDQAQEAYQKALHLYEQNYSPVHLARLLINLGNIHLYRGQFEQAEMDYESAREKLHLMGARLDLALVLNNLGMACAKQARWGAAQTHYRQSIALCGQLDARIDQANTEDNLAEAYLAQGEWELALDVLAQAQEHLEGAPDQPRMQSLRRDIEAHIAQAQAALEEQ